MFFKLDNQKWLRSAIPKTYVDVDYLIEELVFNSLIHFWETGGKDAIRGQYEYFNGKRQDVRDELDITQIELINKRKKSFKIYSDLKDAYTWAKSRGKVELQLNDYTIDQKQKYTDTETHHLSNIIKWREHLWD